MTHRLLCAAALVVSSAAFAAPERPLPARASNPIFAALDVDRNGTVSPEEIAAAPLTLAALDLDGDGVVSADEWQPVDADGHVHRPRSHSPMLTVILALDANHDGALQAMEVANAASSLRRLDLNQDGGISRDELRPMLFAQAER